MPAPAIGLNVWAMQNFLDYLHEHKLESLVGVVAVPLFLALALAADQPAWVRVGAAALVVGFVALVLLAGRLGRRPRGYLGEHIAFSLPRLGLILTLGKQTETPLLALNTQRPQWVGLVCTSATEPEANALVSQLKLDQDHARVCVVDGHNAKDVREQTAQLLAWLKAKGLRKDQMAVDVTGGLTTMSVGAFSAAESARVDTQYVRSDFDAHNKPIAGTQKGVFVVRYSALP